MNQNLWGWVPRTVLRSPPSDSHICSVWEPPYLDKRAWFPNTVSWAPSPEILIQHIWGWAWESASLTSWCRRSRDHTWRTAERLTQVKCCWKSLPFRICLSNSILHVSNPNTVAHAHVWFGSMKCCSQNDSKAIESLKITLVHQMYFSITTKSQKTIDIFLKMYLWATKTRGRPVSLPHTKWVSVPLLSKHPLKVFYQPVFTTALCA